MLLVVAAVETCGDLRAPSWIVGGLWAGSAVVVYLLIPRPSIPEGALRHEFLPSTVMPDIVGFLLGVAFFALPLVVMNSDPLLAGVWPILLIFWPLGLFALAILYIAARYACSWVRLRNDGIQIGGLWEVVDLPFSEIEKVTAIERKLPGWVAPALFLVGGWRGAGVALLHAGRAAHYLEFELKAAASMRFSVDAFPGTDQVIRALDRGGVFLDGELGQYARKISRKKETAS